MIVINLSCCFLNTGEEDRIVIKIWALTFIPLFKADVDALPDVLWPNAKEIICSAVSRCTRYIALGLDDALLCVWDRQSGEQIFTFLLGEEIKKASTYFYFHTCQQHHSSTLTVFLGRNIPIKLFEPSVGELCLPYNCKIH